jgi:hypothetical protein
MNRTILVQARLREQIKFEKSSRAEPEARNGAIDWAARDG